MPKVPKFYTKKQKPTHQRKSYSTFTGPSQETVGEEDVAENITRLLIEAGFNRKCRKTRSHTVEDSSVDLVSKQPIDLTEEKVRQIDTMKNKSSGEDADAQLYDKQDSSRRTDADVHTEIEELSM